MGVETALGDDIWQFTTAQVVEGAVICVLVDV